MEPTTHPRTRPVTVLLAVTMQELIALDTAVTTMRAAVTTTAPTSTMDLELQALQERIRRALQ